MLIPMIITRPMVMALGETFRKSPTEKFTSMIDLLLVYLSLANLLEEELEEMRCQKLKAKMAKKVEVRKIEMDIGRRR